MTNKILKILMLNSEFPPLGGGQGNANKFILKELSKHRDLEIDLITASTNKQRTEQTKSGKIYFLDIGKKNQNYQFQSTKDLLTYSIKAQKLAFKLNKQNKYNLIIAWSGVPAGYVAYTIKKLQKTPYIVLLRGSDVPFWEERWHYLDKYIFSHSTPIIWNNAKHVIANSTGLKNHANKTSKNQIIKVITNGVDTDFFKPLKNKKRNSKTILLGVGRLSKIKAYNHLIKALSELKDLNFELQLVGDGPEKENLIALAKNLGIEHKVKLLGIKNNLEILKIYQSADIFCQTSINEGMSNTMLEAMATGLPIITTKVGGTEELIKDNGFIINITDKKDLKNKLKKLILDYNLRIKFGKKSRIIAEDFDWKKITNKFLKLIK